MRPFAFATAAILLVAAVASVLLLTGDDGSNDAVESTLIAATSTAQEAMDPGRAVGADPGVRVQPGDVPDPFLEGEDLPRGYRQLLGRDDIRPVYDPTFVTAEAIGWNDQDLVLGVEIDGDARAYSISYLNSREMVIDRVAGIPVLVTW